jgi:glyoxylate reductase
LTERIIVVSLSPLPEALIKSLLAAYAPDLAERIEVVTVHGKPRKEKLSWLSRATIVIGDYTFRERIDAEMCQAMSGSVRLIQQPSTGYDHIDVDACREAGVPVANAGGVNAPSVAEYTIMAALILLKRILYAHAKVVEGGWPQWELMEVGTFDLRGKTWGIIGLGRIGTEVAKRLRGWEVRIVYFDKVRRKDLEEQLGVEYRPLPRLLRESDVVSIHVPLTPETRKLIGERELRMMKPTAVLINPSRGEVVDEEALARALRERWIAGAAVDVYSVEPPPPDHPLVKLAREGHPNILLTPHIAGANTDSRAKIIEFSISNIVRVLRGEKPEAVVNM